MVFVFVFFREERARKGEREGLQLLYLFLSPINSLSVKKTASLVLRGLRGGRGGLRGVEKGRTERESERRG